MCAITLHGLLLYVLPSVQHPQATTQTFMEAESTTDRLALSDRPARHATFLHVL